MLSCQRRKILSTGPIDSCFDILDRHVVNTDGGSSFGPFDSSTSLANRMSMLVWCLSLRH